MIKGTIEILGRVIDIVLPLKYLKVYGIEEKHYYLTTGGVGSVMRQVMKEMLEFKQMWLRTESYSGGTSIKVFFEELNNYKLSKSIGDWFEYGSFNPMEDLYEIKGTRNILKLENGVDVNCDTKFCFVTNDIPWDIKHKRERVSA
tara:strand:- start:215 stop:649 length:435 start_codon:yes stop_codon:yes gene_type:complete